MHFYRLSKYSDASPEDEWTSFSDIENQSRSTPVSMDEYLRVENAFVESVNIILSSVEIQNLKIRKLYKISKLSDEYARTISDLKKRDVLSGDRIGQVVRAGLREQLDTFLKHGSKLWISFGHDYYMHLASEEDLSKAKDLIRPLGLFLEDAAWLREGMIEALCG